MARFLASGVERPFVVALGALGAALVAALLPGGSFARWL